MKTQSILLSVTALLLGTSACVKAEPANTGLVIEARSDSMIWNAVAVEAGRVFVAGPRWTGAKGPQLAVLDRLKRPQAYPDAAWNDWRQGADPSKAFVNINAIHLDGSGGLWAVDTGSPTFGGDPLPGAAKLVRIDVRTGKVDRVIQFTQDVALPGSYIDDVRFHGAHAYLTDAGRPGLIIVDLANGSARRVLNDHPAAVARSDRPIVLDGEVIRSPDGQPLRVNSDPLEVSNDGQWLYFGPLEGPWSKVPTSLLDDDQTSSEALAAAVEPWADLPPVGGTAMAPDGSLFFSDLAQNAVKRRYPDGRIETIVSNQSLHWVDAPFLEKSGKLWLPAAQMDRAALFHNGKSQTVWPVTLYSVETKK